jgi:hypothetical protein
MTILAHVQTVAIKPQLPQVQQVKAFRPLKTQIPEDHERSQITSPIQAREIHEKQDAKAWKAPSVAV